MKTILISGAGGFIGNSIVKRFSKEFSIITFNANDDYDALNAKMACADIIIHCSAVTRSENESDFFKVNFYFTSIMYRILKKYENKRLIFFSSIHYNSENLYSISKRYAEFLLGECLNCCHLVHIFRIPGIFGEGAKPNKFSVVSTFAFNAINNIDSQIIDPKKELRLLYISDLLDEIDIALNEMNEHDSVGCRIVDKFSSEILIKVEDINLIMLSFARDNFIYLDADNNVKKFYNTFKQLKDNTYV